MKTNSGAGETAGLVNEFLKAQPIAGAGWTGGGTLAVFSVEAAASAGSGQAGIVYVSNSGTATLRYTGLDLRAMLSNAYGVSGRNVEISPALPAQRFDFLVRVPKASEGIMKQLLRHAVCSVYGVEVRLVKREKRVLLLRRDGRAAHPGLSPAAVEGACSDGRGHLRSAGLKIAALASSLGEKLGLQVLDETGLDGIYGVTLEWAGGDTESLAAALKDQLGLALVPASRVVDSLEAVAAGGAVRQEP